MVNHGPSKGCSTCRKRRVRCDGARPGCRECSRLRRVCGGYESEKKMKTGDRIRFKSQGPNTGPVPRSKTSSMSRARSLTKSITPERTRAAVAAAVTIPATLTPSSESTALCFFLTSIAGLGRGLSSTQGFLEPLALAVTTEHPSSVLSTVLAAVSTKIWAMWTDPAVSYGSPHPPFTTALGRLQAALDDPAERSRDGTVLAATLMHFYESLAARSTHQRTLRAHHDGARALLEHSSDFGSECRAYLKNYLRHCDVSTYLEVQPSDTSELGMWSLDLGWDMPSNPNAVLDRIGLTIASLQKTLSGILGGLARSTSNKSAMEGSALAAWWQDVSSVEAQLTKWPTLLPASWHPYTKPSRDDTITASGLCDIYPTVQIATMWNVWRVCRLLVLRMKLSLLGKVPCELLQQTLFLATEEDTFLDPSIARELVDQIGRSMQFYLGNRRRFGGIHDLADPTIKVPSFYDHDLDADVRAQYLRGDQAMDLLDYRRHIIVQGPSHALLHLNSLIKVLGGPGGEFICRALRADQGVWVREQFLRACELNNPSLRA